MTYSSCRADFCRSGLAACALLALTVGCAVDSDGRGTGLGDRHDDPSQGDTVGCDETLYGTASSDTLRGDCGSDRLIGGAGHDKIFGGDQGDMLLGEAGNDTLEGEHGPDLLNGGRGADTLRGGAGNDYYVYEIGHGDDVISDASGSHDRLTVVGVPKSDVFELRDGDDLILVLPEGSIRIVDQYRGGTIELIDYEWGQDSFADLDYGIHWFGPGNQLEKYIPTVDNPFFDPSRPTMLLAHGWQPGSIEKRRRPGLNYGEDIGGPDQDLADAWIAAGWNVGFFYWQNFADESEVKNAEAKIWSAEGRYQSGMRWLREDGSFGEGPQDFSVGDLAHGSIVAALLEADSPTVRIAGHSLGNQLATRIAALLLDDVEAEEVSPRLLPERLSLLDPFWSKGSKDYFDYQENTGTRAHRRVKQLIDAGVPVDAYRSSAATASPLVGDSNSGLFRDVCLVELRPHYLSWHDLQGKHIMGLWHYVYGFSYTNRDDHGDQVASANAPTSVLWDCIDGDYRWNQVEGRDTQTPLDDEYERIDEG